MRARSRRAVSAAAGSSATASGARSASSTAPASPAPRRSANRPRCAARARGRGPGRRRARRGRARSARQQMAHQGRGHEVLDRLLVEARGELAADVEEVVELVDLHREPLVERLELVVDQAVLDRRGGAGGHAAQEGERPPRSNGAPVRARRPGRARRSRRPARLRRPGSARSADPGRTRPALAASPPGRTPVRSGPRAARHARARRSAARARPQLEGPSAARTSRQPARRLQLAHHDEQRGVEDLVAAHGRAQRAS